MRLTRVFIENFRAIHRLKLDLDQITVLIGENNTGKTSVFDVLGLCLGRPGSALATHFRAADFRCGAEDRKPRSIRVALTFECRVDRDLPEHSPLRDALTRDNRGVSRLQVEFTGHPHDGRVRHRWVDPGGRPLDPQPPHATLDELRRLHPVLLLRFAQRAPPTRSEAPQTGVESRAEQRGRRGLESEVARVYRELALTRGPVPPDDLRRGLAAAHELYEGIRLRHVASLAPLDGMIDGLSSAPEGAAPSATPDRDLERAGSGSHTLGLLMVLGALLDVRGDDTLPAFSNPVIIIEEPEVHLHPILLASTWDVLEGLGAQTLVTTNSGELLSSVPMGFVRRLARRDGDITVHRLHPSRLSRTELRRVGYHIGAKRGGVLFARCWLLVEGETEFWILRQLAQVLGYDLEAEGVRCVEFAQCGVPPLVKLANDLGIEWHLLTDGDQSGAAYANEALRFREKTSGERRVTRLRRHDIERCFWYHGYEHVYRKAAGMARHRENGGAANAPGKVIAKAVKKRSKPYLALTVAEACVARGPEGVPPVLRNVIETAVALARSSVRARAT